MFQKEASEGFDGISEGFKGVLGDFRELWELHGSEGFQSTCRLRDVSMCFKRALRASRMMK